MAIVTDTLPRMFRKRWSTMLLWCGSAVWTGCGANLPPAQPVAGDPSGTSELTSEAPPPPAQPGELWTPRQPVPSTPGAFAWSWINVSPACPAPPATVHQLQIANELEFETAYCRPAAVNWDKFRLVVFNLSMRVVDVDVVAESSRVNVVVQTQHEACNPTQGSQLALLIPKSPVPVVLLMRPDAEPPPTCPEGYGY